VIEGIATVDESCITGESAPVIRESGSDRSAVTAGTKLLSDRIIVKVTCEPGGTFLDRMIHLIENAKRQKTPNEVALNIVLAMLTILFLIAVASLKSFADYSSLFTGTHVRELVTVPVLVGLLVCLIPTTIGALLTAVGIAGMDRLIQHNVIAKSGSAVEAAGDINLLLMDKTGTITLGNRMAAAFIPIKGNSEKEFAEVAQLASIQDETPEGRSIVVLAKEKHNLRAHDLTTQPFRLVPFSARTRMSGIDFLNMNGEVVRSLRKGAMDAIDAHVQLAGNHFPHDARETVETIAKAGGTPLVVAENGRVLGVIHLKDILKGGIRERFNKLRQMGIRTVMVTGDNPLTASSIAAEAGVDDFLAEATPEMKLEKIKTEQKRGRLVAMAGDGTNDAPALACADVGVAMNLGTQASREAGNLVDLDSDPSKLIEIVEIGKQLLMTRGALTTFSIANDIAKYFAILPALFGGLYPLANGQGALQSLNIMHLYSPQSAILSAVIFNALIIIALIPLALFGVKIKAKPAHQLLSRNLLIFGLGGIIAPFIGIKFIDIILSIIGIA
jgi:K+-transporting ATPase ATPase B chain